MIFLKGLFLGLLVSVPPGPVGALCFNRAVSRGKMIGLSAGLGIAFADIVFATFVVAGLKTVSEFMLFYQPYLRLVGAGIFMIIGFRLFVAGKIALVSEKPAKEKPAKGVLSSFSSIFFLALTNPFLILTFAVLFSFFDLHFVSGDIVSPAILLAGIFCGALAWWVFIVYSAEWLKLNLKNFSLPAVNRAVGVAIAVFAFMILAESVFELFL